jgi:hypothetical protein
VRTLQRWIQATHPLPALAVVTLLFNDGLIPTCLLVLVRWLKK